MNLLFKGSLLLASLAVASAASAAGLSEDFSTWNSQGHTANGSWYVTYNTGSNTSDTNGWTIDGNKGTGVDLVGGGYQAATSANTGQWLDLAGTPGPGGIERTMTTPKGNYVMSFSGFSNDGQGFSVLLNNQVLATYSAADLTTAWTTHTVNFNIASSDPQTLKFYTTDGSNGNVGLDNINVQPAPEPVSMTLVGGVLFTAVKRRFKK